MNHIPPHLVRKMTIARELRSLAVLTLVGAVLFGALPVTGQTSDETCAMNSLNLISPDRDGLRVTLSGGTRFGAVVRWTDLDDELTTCGVPIDTLGLGTTVSLDGAYADRIDRQLRFSTSTGGVVGSPDANSILLTWSNANQQFTGRIAGEINLSNNGGLLGLDSTTGQWVQINNGLPQYMTQTDMVGFASSPRVVGRYATHLTGRIGRGLWYRAGEGQSWERLAETIFPNEAAEISAISTIAFSPADDATFVVGTTNRGIYITRDGGATFEQIRDAFAADGNWMRRKVTAINWTTSDELFVAIADLGLFLSSDDASTFINLDSFVVPEVFPTSSSSVPPTINAMYNDGAGRIIAAVSSFGIYESVDYGSSWSWRWTELLAPGAVQVNATSLSIDQNDGNVLVVGTANQGIFRTEDNGTDWDQAEYFNIDGDPNSIDSGFRVRGMIWDSANGRFVAALDRMGMITSSDGIVWEMPAGLQGGIATFSKLLVGDGSSFDVLLSTYGGGIYTPGHAIELSKTIKRNLTDAVYRDLDFGMSISFSEGSITPAREFSLILQDFQGYAVWRGEVGDVDSQGRPILELIGLFDKNNPESCIDGYCGASSYNITPRCYADKRAACFDFTQDGTVGFFDDNIYDGFVYSYAVTTFDYGNTANSSPASLSADQLFSERFPDDPFTIFPGEGNLVSFRVNLDAAAEGGGDEVYAVPNPLRNTSAGLNQSLAGREVHFRNLPPSSRVHVFTVNGDLVAELDDQEGHNISWLTPDDLASGVYIYKVEMPARDDYFGKLVIIR